MADPDSPPRSNSSPDNDRAAASNQRTDPRNEGFGQINGIADPIVRTKGKARISWIWLVPIIAAIVGGSLLVRGWLSTGPVVTIVFESAEGLEAGQTRVRYKNVVVGIVKEINVSPSRDKVLVKAQLDRDSSRYFTQAGTRYWVVRPRLGISGVSGLGTLLSGAYIGVDGPMTPRDGPPIYEFDGLEVPPEVTTDRAGKRFSLATPDLGMLDIGSPVYYRRIPVGQVIGYQLNKDGQSVQVQVFIDAPYDRFVTESTRFWNISGIDLSLSASGVSVKAGTLASVVGGGVAFASLGPEDGQPVKADTVFKLSANETEAMADPDGIPFRVHMAFLQSVRGLKVGAPVDFRGMELGEVVDIDLEFDQSRKRFYVLVKADLYPMRFGAAYDRLTDEQRAAEYPAHALLAPMIQYGLRAQMQAANILTGQQFVSLEFFPDVEPVPVDLEQVPMEIPTVAGSFDRLQQQVSSIVAKIDAVPFEGIGNDLRDSLQSLHQLLESLDKKMGPQMMSTLKAAQESLEKVNKLLADDSSMNANLERTMRELSGAARSLRALGDYLQTNPSALLRGRPADVLPGN